MKGFHKTPDGCRQDFRTARLKDGENYDLFAIKLGRLFDQWVQACDTKQDFKSLRSFVILDQLVSSVSPELRTYLKENDVKTLDQAVKLADSWSAAHRSYSKPSSSTKPKKPFSNPSQTKDQSSSSGPSQSGPKPKTKWMSSPLTRKPRKPKASIKLR